MGNQKQFFDWLKVKHPQLYRHYWRLKATPISQQGLTGVGAVPVGWAPQPGYPLVNYPVNNSAPLPTPNVPPPAIDTAKVVLGLGVLAIASQLF